MSMSPVICGKDRITIAPLSAKTKINIGDVAAAILPGTGTLVIHRIVHEHQGRFLLKGDNLWTSDGCCGRTHILGYVQDVKKEFSGSGLKIRMEKLWWFFAKHKRLIALLSRNRIWTLLCKITNKIP